MSPRKKPRKAKQRPLVLDTKSKLEEFLAEAKGNNEDIMSYDELLGFLYVIVSAPDIISPNEYLPVIFDQEDSLDFSILPKSYDLQNILNDIAKEHNEIAAQLNHQKMKLPRGYGNREDTTSIFESDQHLLSQWARGFTMGYTFIEDDWAHFVQEETELSEELGVTTMVLSFFCDKDLAKLYYKESKSEADFHSFAQEMYELLPDALQSYASIGWSIHQELQENN